MERESRKMHVIIHIGTPKAGSSALQAALARDAEALAQAGFYLPGQGKLHARAFPTLYSRRATGASSPWLRRSFDSAEQVMDWTRATWDELETHVLEHRPPLTLLSGEHFIALTQKADFIARLRRMFDRITLVAYVRDPVAYYVSATDQGIRSGKKLADLAVPKARAHSRRDQIMEYERLIGREAMVVRNLARSNLVGGDVGLDFYATLSALTGRDLSALPAAPMANESLPAALSVWLLTQNQMSLDSGSYGNAQEVAALQARRDLLRRLRGHPALAGLPKLRMTEPRLEAAVLHHSREDSDWINRTFLAGQVPLPVGTALETPPEPPELRAALRRWLFGQITAPEIGPMLEALIPPGKPAQPHKKGGKAAG